MQAATRKRMGIHGVEVAGNIVRWLGLVIVVPGLWYSASGMRVLVSGRIDERKRSARSLRVGLPLLVVGVVMLFGGTWLANLVQTR